MRRSLPWGPIFLWESKSETMGIEYGQWERCGQSSFWRRKLMPGETWEFFLDPIDALYVVWKGNPASRGMAVDLETARIPMHVPGNALGEAIMSLSGALPTVLRDYMRTLNDLWVHGADRDRVLRFFLQKFPKEADIEFEGQPTREMILTGVYLLMEELRGETVHERRTVLTEELGEILAEEGIVGCR